MVESVCLLTFGSTLKLLWAEISS